MKKNLIKSIKVLSLCLVFSLFVGIVVVGAQAPANNVYGPLNSGPTMQSKSGSLRITNGGFRSAGPGLFDDLVVVGYSGNAAQYSGELTSFNSESKNNSYKNKSEGIFTKLSKFFGLNTEKVMAAQDTGVELGGTVPIPIITYGQCGSAAGQSFSTNPRTTQSASALCSSGTVGNFDPNIMIGTAGYWAWGCYGSEASSHADDMVCGANNTTTTGGTIGIGTPITPVPFETYKFTVNGRSNLNGYTKVEGGLDVAGAITSGGKNVCLQDGTNCSVAPKFIEFGGTYEIKAGTNGQGTNCVTSNQVYSTISPSCQCANIDGYGPFTAYPMASYSKVTGSGLSQTTTQISLMGCFKKNSN